MTGLCARCDCDLDRADARPVHWVDGLGTVCARCWSMARIAELEAEVRRLGARLEEMEAKCERPREGGNDETG